MKQRKYDENWERSIRMKPWKLQSRYSILEPTYGLPERKSAYNFAINLFD